MKLIEASLAWIAGIAGLLYLVYAFFVLGQIGNEYLPCWTDEFMYHVHLRSFLLHNSLASPIVMNEMYSQIGKFGPHGFMYAFIDGIFTIILGLHENTAIPYINLFLTLIAIILIFISRKTKFLQKLLLSGLLITSYVPSFYLLTYMQEYVHLPLCVLAILFLHRTYTETRNKSLYRNLFILTVLIGSFFRINWIFWLIALLPTQKKLSQKIAFIIVYLLVSYVAYLFFRLFNGVYPLGFLYKVTTTAQSGTIKQLLELFISHIWYNIKTFLNPKLDANFFYFASKWLVVVFMVYYWFVGNLRQNKLYLAASAVVFVNLALLFIFYDAHSWREQRSLAASLYLCIGVAVLSDFKLGYALVLFINLLNSYSQFQTLQLHIQERRKAYENFQENTKLREAFRNISNYITQNHPVTILVSYSFMGDHKPYQLCFPLASQYGYPILYSFNARDWIEIHSSKVDYVLTQVSLRDNTQHILLARTPYYCLYRVNKQIPFSLFKEY
ncbi:MAG: hypothetical protein NZM38_01385 [Cytophagales bacterium]|nr:hypothetical protein [Cytophagales bacterium]MDW8383403.1 hypothetical protein [Flammeovirgaceae bacterium]